MHAESQQAPHLHILNWCQVARRYLRAYNARNRRTAAHALERRLDWTAQVLTLAGGVRIAILAAALVVAGLHAPAAAWAAPALSPPQAPAAQEPQQVYALQGTLRPAQNQPFSTYLETGDGQLFGLYGATPETAAQIDAALALGPETQVKVWGTYYPTGRQSESPEIIASAIEVVGAAATPTSPPSAAAPAAAPMAVGRFDYVNLRAGPGQSYAVVGQLVKGESCPVVGRNASGSWLQLRCSDTLTGWLETTVVEVQGSLADVPVVEGPPPQQPTPTPSPTPPMFYQWKASYYANRDLTGQAAAIADVANVNFDWGLGSPYAQVPVDNFSARYERTLGFSPGNYRLFFRMDDGVRLWIDGQIVLDEWREGAARDAYVERSLSGDHAFRIDYVELYERASVYFAYGLYANRDDWNASYYNNPDLAGNPILFQVEARTPVPLDKNWGTGSPAPGVIGADNFSARWQSRFFFDSGTYVFQVRSDDGVRVYLDGQRIVDDWRDGYRDIAARVPGIIYGEHQITVEYYERTGSASIQMSWYRESGNPYE